MSKHPIFRGAGTALITPFREDGSLDADAFSALVRRAADSGVSAVITGGTTGEAATLTDAERTELIRLAKSSAGGALPVIAGAGSNDTAHAVRMAREAETAGADALLVITPYCNKTSPQGLTEYYRAVCGATSLPVVLYSVPSRTGMRLPEEVWGELFSIPNLVGIKDASGDLAAAGRLLARFGQEISVWSGSDELTLPYLSLGGDGVISVVSNLFPAETEQMCRLFFDGKVKEAAELAARLSPVCEALFCEVNPIPVKYALAGLGLCLPVYRAPLCPPSEKNRERIRSAAAAELSCASAE